MEITFITPKVYQAQFLEAELPVYSLGIPYLSAALKLRGHNTSLINGEMLGTREFIEKLQSINSKVIGITSMLFNIRELFDLVNYLRERHPSKILIAGGRGVSSLPAEYVFKKCRIDCIFHGEAERSLCSFLDMIQARAKNYGSIPGLCYRGLGGRIIVNRTDLTGLANLDDLPFPDRDLHDEKRYLAAQKRLTCGSLGPPMIRIHTGRGCPFNCAFCDRGEYPLKIRLRSTASILSEIRHCIEKYDCRDFFFNDDLFVASQPRLEEFCRAVISSGLNITWKANARVNSLPDKAYPLLRKAGCAGLFFGVESGSDRMLAKINKGVSARDIRRSVALCAENNISPFGYFVVGIPGETVEDHKATLSLMLELPFSGVEVFICMPYPNTPLFNELAANCPNFSWDAYTTWHDNSYSESKARFLNYEFEADPLEVRNMLLRSFAARNGINPGDEPY
jgi:radical SAM superfamily enzyme YgiQ (UPF0313 family)